MLPDHQPLFANLNLASLSKIELSCQRFVNIGNKIVKIGAVLPKNLRNVTNFTSDSIKNVDKNAIFSRQIFGSNFDEIGNCLCGLSRQKNPYSIQVLIRDNERIYWTVICGVCLMEYLEEDVRMSRMGLINLPTPVLHVWYASYASRLLMCGNKFIFSSLYGRSLTLILLPQKHIRLNQRRNNDKYIEIDGTQTSGILIPRNSDKFLNYNALFLPKDLAPIQADSTYPGSFFGFTSDNALNFNKSILSLDQPSSQRKIALNFEIEKFQDAPFMKRSKFYKSLSFDEFFNSLKKPQFLGFMTKDCQTVSDYDKFLKFFGVKIYQYLSSVRFEQAMLMTSRRPQTFIRFFDLISTPTYNRLSRMTIRYILLYNWLISSFNLKTFYLTNLVKKRNLNIRKIIKNILFEVTPFKQKLVVAFDFLYNTSLVGTKTTVWQPSHLKSSNWQCLVKWEGKPVVLTLPIFLFLNDVLDSKSLKRLLSYQKRQIKRRAQRNQTVDLFKRPYNNLLTYLNLVWPEAWSNKTKMKSLTRYIAAKKLSIFNRDTIQLIPNLLIRDLEKNWHYNYKTIDYQDIRLTNVSSIYNNYWEIASKPVDKSTYESLCVFFSTENIESFAEVYQPFFNENTNIYEYFFIDNPRNIWHNLHLLPFNLFSRSHTSWKEMSAVYSAPYVESASMLKFMLQNLSDLLLLKRSLISSKIRSNIVQENIFLFKEVFAETFFFSLNILIFSFLIGLYIFRNRKNSNCVLKFLLVQFFKFSEQFFIQLHIRNYSNLVTILINKLAHKKNRIYSSNSFLKLRTKRPADIQIEHMFFNKKIEKGLTSMQNKIITQRRLRERMLQTFYRLRSRFEWIILNNLPILPINLRPVVKMGEGESLITVRSEINNLYSSIIYRAGWILRIQENKSRYPQYLQITNIILLQQSIENLFGNPYTRFRPNSSITSNEEMKGFSLLDRLKGKFGRLRRQLLGKRVDYSGRSVIVVGPLLELNMCALPLELGFQIFQPLLMYMLSTLGIAQNLTAARHMISTSQPKVKNCLHRLVDNEVVLLNRAPTLHRMNFQTFYPIITNNKSISLHPLVCSSFNADFDGDQMAVHLPLSVEARLEARIIMMSNHNLLSPSTGAPTILPTQDMVLGCYYLTVEPPSRYLKLETYLHLRNLELLIHKKNISFHDWVWIQHNGLNIQKKDKIRQKLETRIYEKGVVWSIFLKSQRIDDYLTSKTYSFIGTTFGRVIFNKVLGFDSNV